MFSKREYFFYVVIFLAVLIFELAIPSGLYLFLSLPLALGVIAVGIWVFTK